MSDAKSARKGLPNAPAESPRDAPRVAGNPGSAPRRIVGSDLDHLLLQSIRDYAIFALDADGNVLTWTPSAERLNGYAADEIIGKHFSLFYSEHDLAAGKPAHELEVATSSGAVEDEGWRIRKDGSRFWANVVITALRDESGQLVGFAKVTRDMTERRKADDRKLSDERRIAAAESANRAKSEFLTTMSHELRTPLNAIGGYAELLTMGLGGPVTIELTEFLDRIRRSQQHLLGIITDILNFSRIEAGQIVYDIRTVAAAEVVDTVLPMVLPQAVVKGLRLVASVPPTVCVAADRGKLEQVLLNLLSNAIKFTPTGRIEINGFATGTRAGIQIRDTGIGVPADKLESIFEPFVQVGRSLTTTHGGTGLGLAISRDLTRAMGGELTAESEPGKGTTFTVALKRAG